MRDMIGTLLSAESQARLQQARESAGNDMLKSMQLVFPLNAQIQMEVIARHGFPGDGEGLIRFSQAVKACEKQDAELQKLSEELRTIVIPQIAVPASAHS